MSENEPETRETGAPPAGGPLGVGSLAANVVAQAAQLVAVLARAEGDAPTVALAQSIGTRAEALSISNDTVFTAATEQLVAAATGEDDGRCLEDALGDAASAPRVICETARDLALLADTLAHTCDGVRRADYVGIAHLSAAAASTALELVRSNLVVGDDDLRLATASSAAAEAAHAALRASSTGA